MNKFLSKRGFIVIAVFLVALILAIYVENQPRQAPGQEPLTDITSIETLRTQFNRDEGFPRLILLASPT
jgi:hypothetical protein